jgi:hypothetical protein
MAPELEALRVQNASLHEELEVKAKRIAQLEAAPLKFPLKREVFGEQPRLKVSGPAATSPRTDAGR